MPSTYQCCIGLIGQIIGTEIVVAHIAQQITDTRTFFIQIEHIELFARADKRASATSLHDTHGSFIKALEVYRIYYIWITKIYRILQLNFLRIFLIGKCLVRNFTIKIAKFTKDIFARFLSDSRIHLRQQYRIGSKAVEYPPSNTFFILVFLKAIIHPQAYRERYFHC